MLEEIFFIMFKNIDNVCLEIFLMLIEFVFSIFLILMFSLFKSLELILKNYF